MDRRDQPYYDANRLSNFGNSVNSTSGEQKSLNFDDDVPEKRKNRFLFAFAVLMPVFVCYCGVKVGDKAQGTEATDAAQEADEAGYFAQVMNCIKGRFSSEDASEDENASRSTLNDKVEKQPGGGENKQSEDLGEHRHADILPVVHRFHSKVNTSQTDSIMN